MANGHETQRCCPDDQTPLQKVNDRDVKIDWCPTCGVTVLDPGELQVLINRVASMSGLQTRPAGYFAGGYGHGRRHGSSDGSLGGFFGGSS